MAKGKGSKRASSSSKKKGFGSSSSNQPSSPPSQPQEQQHQASPAEGQEDSGGYSILGSAPTPAAPARKGFGASRQEVDDAYEQALSKIKGEPSKKKGKPMFGGGADGPDPTMGGGRVPVKNVDIFDVIPQPIQNGFETVLIAALAANLLVIIGLGIGFSVQAIPTSNLDLPEAVLSAATTIRPLVEQLEFLFSPALVSFFVLSSFLGAFKLGQLGKGGTTYREKQ